MNGYKPRKDLFALLFSRIKGFKKRSVIKGVLFLLLIGLSAFFIARASTSLFPTPSSPIVFYANQLRDDLKLLFCEAIARAQKSLYVNFYAITDKDLIAALVKKAVSGLPLTLFYDKTASLSLSSHFPRSTHIIAHQSKGLMHRKILVIDNAYLLLGSANLTPSSLRHHSNLVLGLYSPALAEFLSHQQDRACSSYHLTIANQPVECYLLPDKEQKASHRLLCLIQSAQKTIRVAMFTLTHPQLTAALIDAVKRGVRVCVIIDSYSARGASKKTVQKLQKAGVAIFLSQGQELLHHKWAIIDEDTLAMGSANWTRAAFTKNEDFLLLVSNLSEKQKKFLNQLWKILKIESISNTQI